MAKRRVKSDIHSLMTPLASLGTFSKEKEAEDLVDSLGEMNQIPPKKEVKEPFPVKSAFVESPQEKSPQDKSILYRLGQYLGDTLKMNTESENAQNFPEQNPVLPLEKIPAPSMDTLGNQGLPQESGLSAPPKPSTSMPEPNSIPENALALDMNAANNEKERSLQPSVPEIATEEKKTPGEFAEPGLLEDMYEDPDSRDLLSQLAGKPLTQEDIRRSEEWAQALDSSLKDIADMSEQQRKLVEKLDSGNLTTMDKFFIGLALAAPALIGLAVGGKEGLFSAAGASLSNFSKEMGNDVKRQDALRKEIGDLSTSRAQLAMKAMEMQSKLQDAIPNQKLREEVLPHLVEVLPGKLGVKVSDELIMKPQMAKTYKNYENMLKKTEELEKGVAESKNLEETLNKLDMTLDQLEEQGFVTTALNHIPMFRQKIIIDGKEMDGISAAKQIEALLIDGYRKANKMRALTNVVAGHAEKIIAEPGDWKAYFNGKDIKTIQAQAHSLRQEMRQRLLNDLETRGFYKEPMENFYKASSFDQKSNEKALKNQVLQDLSSNPAALSGEWQEVSK